MPGPLLCALVGCSFVYRTWKPWAHKCGGTDPAFDGHPTYWYSTTGSADNDEDVIVGLDI